jgi:glyoxylase I family protein
MQLPAPIRKWWSRLLGIPTPLPAQGEDDTAASHRLADAIYGLSVNCSNLERSLEFYRAIGFKEVADIAESGGGALEKALRIPSPRARGRLLKLGDDPHAINLDLIEWVSPRTEGRAYPRLNHAGITRIALHTSNLQKTYEELKAKGIEFYSEPQVMQFHNGSSLFVCFEDPDGTVLELLEFRPAQTGEA